MRIISGKYKGQQLVAFKAEHIRPTTDRVKESIFNIIRFELEGSRVLDLFAGTGNLTIESISQYAKSVCSVESSPKSLKIIRANLEKIGIKNEVQVVAKDVFIFLRQFNYEPFDIIFIDPPFTKIWADKVLLEISNSRVLKDESLVIIEATSKEDVKNNYGLLKQVSAKKFGDKIAYFFKYNPVDENT